MRERHRAAGDHDGAPERPADREWKRLAVHADDIVHPDFGLYARRIATASGEGNSGHQQKKMGRTSNEIAAHHTSPGSGLMSPCILWTGAGLAGLGRAVCDH